MRALNAALRVELRKATASTVLWSTTIIVVTGIAVLGGTLVAAAIAGNEQILSQLGPLAAMSGWSLLTGITAQITAAGALLGFGVGLAWTFGREFVDGTITGLFALPVSRPTIALAKLLTYLLWVVLVAAMVTILVLLAGILLELGPVDGEVLQQLARQYILTALTGLLATPAAWAATLGRGLLLGIGTTVGILVAANVTAIGFPAAAAWLLLPAPALWALQPETVHGWQLVAVAAIPIAFGILTADAWRRLQLDA